MSTNKIDNSEVGVASQELEADIALDSNSTNSLPDKPPLILNSNTRKNGQLVKTKPKSANKSRYSSLKSKIAIALISSSVMLPILAIGTVTYYLGHRNIARQTILAKRANTIELVEQELAQQQKLLAALLIGTGATALLAGIIAAAVTKRMLEQKSQSLVSTSKPAEKPNKQLYKKFIQNLQSVSSKDVLQNIVQKARQDLECDRVVIYSLDRDKYGVIVAESVVAGYTKALGKTIVDPCFEARYLAQYRDGRVKAIDDINQASMTACYIEQLEQLEVKANLVAPIINDKEQLFGLLVAHQCSTPRHWETSEIEFLRQLGNKAGLMLENASLSGKIARLQTQAAKEREWTNYFIDAVQHIRQSIQQDDVLETSVEEVRRVLSCDRVVVYSLNGDNYGVVVAESVAAGYPRALNKTIEDPCFAARYLDKYRDGRVRAIDNIHEAGMTSCYIEQLETLEVKANLVTPIINEGELFGLLVAHQCSAPRHWQDYEIRWLTQIATQVGFALDNAGVLVESNTRQIEAARERQWTNYFTDAVQYIRQSLKQDNVLEISVEEVRRVLSCDRVVVYSLNGDNYGVVVAESVAAGYPRALNKTIEDPCFAARYLDKYRDGRVRAIDNIHEAGMTSCYIEQLETLEVKANLVTPIINEGELFGLLVAHQCSAPRHWQDYEIRWLTQIATQVGFALDNASMATNQQQAEGIAPELWISFNMALIDATTQSELLKDFVEEARKIIDSDRVVVYKFAPDWKGTIIAESVVAGYPRILNTQIEDPCFAEKYAEQYRQGRTKAIANIHYDNLSDCYLKQLEKLGVKASLVAPILVGEELFGLSIAHQFDKPRLWKQSENDLFAQLARQIGSALERIELRQTLSQTHNELSEEPKQVSELIAQTQATLQKLQAQIQPQSLAIADDSLTTEDQQMLNYADIDESSILNSETNLSTAQKAIAESTEKTQSSERIQKNFYQMTNFVSNLREDSNSPVFDYGLLDRDTIEPAISPAISIGQIMPTQSITEAVIIENDEMPLQPVHQPQSEIDRVTGQIVSNQSSNSSLLMNQFVAEIANLSDRMSQQSLAVTHSFQKLAAFAKQLSNLDETPK